MLAAGILHMLAADARGSQSRHCAATGGRGPGWKEPRSRSLGECGRDSAVRQELPDTGPAWSGWDRQKAWAAGHLSATGRSTSSCSLLCPGQLCKWQNSISCLPVGSLIIPGSGNRPVGWNRRLQASPAHKGARLGLPATRRSPKEKGQDSAVTRHNTDARLAAPLRRDTSKTH